MKIGGLSKVEKACLKSYIYLKAPKGRQKERTIDEIPISLRD